MESSQSLCSRQSEHLPRHQHHHYQLSSGPEYPPLSHQRLSSLPALPLLSPDRQQHHPLSSQNQLPRTTLDDDRVVKATSDGGPGITRTGVTPAPVAHSTNPLSSWSSRHQLPVGMSIYNPQDHVLWKQGLTSVQQHHHSFSLPISQPSSHSHRASDLEVTSKLKASMQSSPSVKQSFFRTPTEYHEQPQSYLEDTRAAHYQRLLPHQHDIHSVVMTPFFQDSPTMVPIMSSSLGKGECEALPESLAETGLADSLRRNDSQLYEGSEATSSPQSSGLLTTSESDGLSTSSQEEASPPLRHELFQALPTTPFRFPSSRHNGSCDSSTDPVQRPAQQQQQPQKTVEPTSRSGGFFGYCFDRGNGLYTRLVPADQLPPSAGYSALQSGCNGMIVLQDPLSQGVPDNQCGPVLQPKTRAYAFAPADAFMQRPGQGGANAHFNNKIAKRNKVYCDKWVHEGICAFTQQGCKFKHEMPHDRSVQRSLGLFHGYPNWYKRQHTQHQRTINMDAASRFPQAPQVLSARQRHAFSFDPHSPDFAPKNAAIRPDRPYTLSVPTVPPVPPTTPLSLQQRTEVYLPPVIRPSIGGSGSPAIARSHLRDGSRSSSSSSTNSLCRTSGVYVPLWRPSQRGAKMKNRYLDDDSNGYLAERFVRSLTLGELPASRFCQSQSQQEQQPQVLQPRTSYPADSFPGWNSHRGRLGSLAALDSGPPDCLLKNIGEHGSFGPIGPPPRDLSDEIPLPASYAFNKTHNLSHGMHPEDDGAAFD